MVKRAIIIDHIHIYIVSVNRLAELESEYTGGGEHTTLLAVQPKHTNLLQSRTHMKQHAREHKVNVCTYVCNSHIYTCTRLLTTMDATLQL